MVINALYLYRSLQLRRQTFPEILVKIQLDDAIEHPGRINGGGVLYPPYKIRLNVVNALIFAPEHHIIKRKLF